MASIGSTFTSQPKPSNSFSIFSEILSVVSGSTNLITSYQVPNGSTAFLQKVEVSGDNVATFDIKLNGSTIARKRTYFSGPLNEVIDFSAFSLVSNDLVEVYVYNFRPMSGNFEARIQYQVGS